jgi:putative tributyrin esterase
MQMRRSPGWLLFAAAALSSSRGAAGQLAVQPGAPTVVRFTGASLTGEQVFSILLPAGYERSTRRYPVLYLLHGVPQDHTTFSSRSWFAAQASRDVIIVTPNAGKSWYVNSVVPPEDRYEDFIIKDLIGYVDSHYRTVATRGGRAIAGISMGGVGAMMLGLKHPRLFSTVGAFSAPFAISRLSMPESEMVEPTQQRFGPPASQERRARDSNTIAAEIAVEDAPRLVISCGGQDGFVTQSRRFVERLATRKIPYEYRELSPYEHSMEIFDRELPAFIASLADSWSQPNR